MLTYLQKSHGVWSNMRSLTGILEDLALFAGSLIQNSFDGYIVLHKFTEIFSSKREGTGII